MTEAEARGAGGTRHWTQWAGLVVVVCALIGILAAPLNDVAWFLTKDGAGNDGLLKWTDAGHDLFRPLIDWSDPVTVYRTWGKLVAGFGVAFILGFFAFRARRVRPAVGAEKWGFRIGMIGYPLLGLGVISEYWGPRAIQDPSFVALSIPGLLLTLIGSTLLGIGMVRREGGPRATAWLLTFALPLTIGMNIMTGHLGTGAYPLALAWLFAGVWLWRSQTA